MHGSPVEDLQEIVACCSQLLDMPGYGGETPLHIACRDNVGVEVIQLLASADALRTEDMHSNLPLHTHCSSENDGSLRVNVIQSLVTLHPESKYNRAQHGPIHTSPHSVHAKDCRARIAPDCSVHVSSVLSLCLATGWSWVHSGSPSLLWDSRRSSYNPALGDCLP